MKIEVTRKDDNTVDVVQHIDGNRIVYENVAIKPFPDIEEWSNEEIPIKVTKLDGNTFTVVRSERK